MLKRKAAIQGVLCAVWLILNWFRPGLLSAGVLCAVLTAQIVMQDFIEERRSLSLKKGWRAGAAFAAGAILTTIMILLPSKIEAGQALLSVGNALAFGLAGTLCIAVLFLEDTSKKQKAAGCVIFAVMLALCTALMRTSQGKNVLSLAFMQKDTVFAPRMSTLYGLVVLPCLQAVLLRICRKLRSRGKQKGDPACGWPCRSALAGAYSAACCLLFFTEDGNHAGGKPDLDLVETACTAAGAALCGGMAGRRREKGKIRVKSRYLRESGLTNRPIACILYKNVSVPMAQRRISLCKEVPKGCE